MTYIFKISGDFDRPVCRSTDLAGWNDLTDFLDYSAFAEDYKKTELSLSGDIGRDGIDRMREIQVACPGCRLAWLIIPTQ